ncbi:asparaginase [Billgrantia zhangzhouensis]|uniref:asparaginase n=1 Tax=Billgrantia zhangzhouensis TaxID=2733481 RepID=UPI001F3E42DD|nr:asparaginase [Halomonas zhangzhouensis]
MPSRTVAIITTGGTISAAGAPGATTNYKDGVFEVDALAGSVPGLSDLAQIKGENFCSQSSTDLTADQWLGLAARVVELTATDVDGIVITHGTDTLDEIAYFLHLTCHTDKPIVITGAMRPATATSADGPLNLYQAVAVAAHPESAGRGALVVFQDTIYSARDVQKLSTFKVDAFGGREYGCLGYIRDHDLHYLYRSEKRHTSSSEFDLNTVTQLPSVPVLFFGQHSPST